MNLTREEFSLFNIRSKLKFLKKDGKCINSRMLDAEHNLMLYRVYNFYVEMLINRRTNDILNIEPVLRKEGLTLYSERPD